jgi:type II secretory pathway component PulK
MTTQLEKMRSAGGRIANRRGSILIIVLWVSFGLVSLALYFAHSMSFELRAADHRVAAVEAEQAIEGAARYVAYILDNSERPGSLPELTAYRHDAVSLGQARFWLVGRDANESQPVSMRPVFGLVDEASKLNLNTATAEMLEALPRMTPELAAAIVDWRDEDDEITSGGAESETYLRFKPTYQCKNAPFESVEELRLVHGMDLEVLYGEDTNLNGVLDPNENDGHLSLPDDNRDGRLDRGILDYVTVFSREPGTREDGSSRLNIRTAERQTLQSLLEEHFSASRASEILQALGPNPGGIRSVLEFFQRGGLTGEESAQIGGAITVSDAPATEGLINVNTASAEVLACLPGIDEEKALSLVSYRQSHPDALESVAWAAEVLDQEAITRAGPLLTAHSYQFTADIAAVGRLGRGYRRVIYLFDSSGEPRVLYRQDRTRLGWALGSQTRRELSLAKGMP